MAVRIRGRCHMPMLVNGNLPTALNVSCLTTTPLLPSLRFYVIPSQRHDDRSSMIHASPCGRLSMEVSSARTAHRDDEAEQPTKHPSTKHTTTSSQRPKTLARNRRKKYLEMNPAYFSADSLEHAGPQPPSSYRPASEFCADPNLIDRPRDGLTILSMQIRCSMIV